MNTQVNMSNRFKSSPSSYDKETTTALLMAAMEASTAVEDTNGDAKRVVASPTENENEDETGIVVNEAKIGALLYFPLIALALTSCLADMYHRNHNMHREPNLSEALLADCAVKDPDSVFLLLVFSYVLVIISTGVLCKTMLSGFRFHVRSCRSSRNSITTTSSDTTTLRGFRLGVAATSRLCLLGIYAGMYNYDTCMGSIPYQKKKTAQVFLACMVLSFCGSTLSRPILSTIQAGVNTTPLPRWPLFLLQIMVYFPYLDAGFWKWEYEWKETTLKWVLVDHYILFELPIAKMLIDGPQFMIKFMHAATIAFECFGWVLVFFGYSRTAALVALGFHIGIYLTMKINYILIWVPSFVFFFVSSIATSKRFQTFAKRLMSTNSGDGKSIVWLLWLPMMFSLLRIGISKEDDEHSSTNKGLSPESKSSKPLPPLRRVRNSLMRLLHKCKCWSILFPIIFGLTLTYKTFVPPISVSFFPELPESIVGSHDSLLYRFYHEAGVAANHPFYSWTMFATAHDPAVRTVTYVNYRRPSEDPSKKWSWNKKSQETVTTDSKTPSYTYRKERWIPDRIHEEYFFLAILSKRHQKIGKLHRELELASGRKVTRCQLMACFAKKYMLFDRNGEEYVLLPPTAGGMRRRTPKVRNGPWDIVSIEIGSETYNHPSVSSDADDDTFARSGPTTLHKQIDRFCVLDLNIDDPAGNKDSDDEINRFDGDSCDVILEELDESRKLFQKAKEELERKQGNDTSRMAQIVRKTKTNPYRMTPTVYRSSKTSYACPDRKKKMLYVMMVFMAYKMYRLVYRYRG